MSRNRCDEELLNRFFDQEIGPDKSLPMRQHLEHCAACQRALQENAALSAHFGTGLDQELSGADHGRVEENVIAIISREKIRLWTKLRGLFFSKRFFVPATAMAAALLLFVLLTPPTSLSGPSAIISSFEGDVASVMILETPESHQTILWISENVTSAGDNGNG
ncbi:MAG: zf-HC2 domain-containing protein [Thermodesulfobacteriota bacterium]|nr:zf-HC2 domain-containing protein [Thermodesulfobacteriota bacterium]